jgi:hypothetical protein
MVVEGGVHGTVNDALVMGRDDEELSSGAFLSLRMTDKF